MSSGHRRLISFRYPSRSTLILALCFREQILGVTSVPMRRYWKAPPRKPSSVDSIKIYEDHEVGTTQKVAQKVAVLDVPTSDEEVMRPRLQGTLIGEENTQAQPSRDRDLKDTSEVAEKCNQHLSESFCRWKIDGSESKDPYECGNGP